jgi:hypothetical protein
MSYLVGLYLNFWTRMFFLIGENMSEEYNTSEETTPPQKLTQSQVDEACENAKYVWEEYIAASGLSQEEFIIKNTGWVIEFLTYLKLAKRIVEREGLVMREVVSGIDIELGGIA